ncbi:MAG TPA: AtpZ/AtpI family protein [Acidimicrobiales bacterium]
MFDVRAKQQLNRGYSDGLARGMELVLAPLVMGGFGWLLDGWFGTDPFLAIGFGAFGIAGIFTKLVTGYDKAMAVEQQGKPWMRDTAPGRPADEAAG